MEIAAHFCRNSVLPLSREACECGMIVCARNVVACGERQLFHDRGRIILTIIGAHAVQAPVIHQIGFLEASLARNDIRALNKHAAVGRDELLRLRGRALIGYFRRPDQKCRSQKSGREKNPFQDGTDRIRDWCDAGG